MSAQGVHRCLIHVQAPGTPLRFLLPTSFCAAALILFGCGSPKAAPSPPSGTPQTLANGPAPGRAAPQGPAVSDAKILSVVDLRGSAVVPRQGTPKLGAARGEWTSVLLRLDPSAAGNATTLQLPTWASATASAGVKIDAYQVLPVPLDINQAAYLRQTGESASTQSLPRAMLPLKIENNRIDLSRLRDPRSPAKPSNGMASGQPLLIWIDALLPIETPPGNYAGNAVLANSTGEVAHIRIDLQVFDFVLPDDRKLNVVAEVPWASLQKHWPDEFEAARPRLLNRNDPKQKAPVAILDQMMSLAEANRVQLHIDRLQPTVKWPSGAPVRIDWDDYDALVSPWLSGQAFADKVPMGSWELPRIDFLQNIPAAARLEYYASAAGHFDQKDWLRFSPVTLDKLKPGRATVDERLLLSAEAARVLRSHQRLRVQVPLELDEVQVSDNPTSNLIPAVATGRLDCVAPGLISSSPLSKWPANLDRPRGWMRTDLSGLIPHAGAGGQESDVRVWAWVAYLRHANLISWGDPLPAESDLATPADPTRLVWFYPGKWFGVDGLVPTVQLKWLRQAEQDFEYLNLADQRGSRIAVLPMARVLSRPVEIQPGQQPDPVYGLLLGAADARAWADVKPLLANIILSRGPGITPDENAISDLNIKTLTWMEPLEKPVILARTTKWTVGLPPPGEIGPWVNLQLGIDLYNASDTTPSANELSYKNLVAGWEVAPQPVQIPQLLTYQVVRRQMNARLDPSRVSNAKHEPVKIEYRSGYSGALTPLDFIAPVARTVRRTAPLAINGSLDDWTGDDALQLGPLVKFMARPSVQAHVLERAATPTDLYSAWNDDKFYLAFRVEGISQAAGVQAGRNFVEYESGRAWAEDVCQVVMQGIYDDGTTGPLVHIALKPGGNTWAEQYGDPRLSVEPWQEFDPGLKYAATADGKIWRGELSIPWKALISPEKTETFARQAKPNLPTIVKFNFIQHRRDTGESASWAGPIDTGRSDGFTGVLVLKEPQQ